MTDPVYSTALTADDTIQGIEYLSRALRRDESLVSALWLRAEAYDLLRQNQDTVAAERMLATLNSENTRDEWMGRLFDVFTGELSPADLLAAAATDSERVEGHYYIGRKLLLDGDAEAARASFEACLAFNRNDLVETDFARVLLGRLEPP